MRLKLKCNLCQERQEVFLEHQLFAHMRRQHGLERGGVLNTMLQPIQDPHISIKNTISIAINKQNMCEMLFRFLLLEESRIADLLRTPTHGLGLINRTRMMKLPYELEFRKFGIVDKITSLKAHFPYFSIKSFELLQMLRLI